MPRAFWQECMSEASKLNPFSPEHESVLHARVQTSACPVLLGNFFMASGLHWQHRTHGKIQHERLILLGPLADDNLGSCPETNAGLDLNWLFISVLPPSTAHAAPLDCKALNPSPITLPAPNYRSRGPQNHEPQAGQKAPGEVQIGSHLLEPHLVYYMLYIRYYISHVTFHAEFYYAGRLLHTRFSSSSAILVRRGAAEASKAGLLSQAHTDKPYFWLQPS